MRYRDPILNKLDKIEADMLALQSFVNQQRPVQDYINKIDAIKQDVDYIRSMVSMEPKTSNEGAGFR